MDFKWIGFLIEWILNELDHRKNGLDHKNWIFCPPLITIHKTLFLNISFCILSLRRFLLYTNNTIWYM